MLYYIMLRYVVSHYIIVHHITLCYIALFYVILCFKYARAIRCTYCIGTRVHVPLLSKSAEAVAVIWIMTSTLPSLPSVWVVCCDTVPKSPETECQQVFRQLLACVHRGDYPSLVTSFAT